MFPAFSSALLLSCVTDVSAPFLCRGKCACSSHSPLTCASRAWASQCRATFPTAASAALCLASTSRCPRSRVRGRLFMAAHGRLRPCVPHTLQSSFPALCDLFSQRPSSPLTANSSERAHASFTISFLMTACRRGSSPWTVAKPSAGE